MKVVPAMLVVMAGMVLAGAAQADELVRIQAVVSGSTASSGQILGSLFDSEATYMEEPRVRVVVTVDAAGQALLDFGMHPPGDYAVVAIYDQDSDGELDTGFLGIPKEKVGFSNNAWGRFGPAKGVDARFEALTDIHQKILIKGVKD
jgi:uncharacterized protein (DUF2141 family)